MILFCSKHEFQKIEKIIKNIKNAIINFKISISERRRRFSKKSNNLNESNKKIIQKKGKKFNQNNKTRNNKEK